MDLETQFLSNSWKCCVVWNIYDFVQISLACGTNIFKEMYGETWLPMSVLAMAAWKSLNGKFTAKIDFLDWTFYHC